MGETSISFDRLADVYDATRGGVERGKRFADDVAPWLEGRSGTILEVGAGTGAVAFPLHVRVQRPVVGIDLSPAMLARAAGRLGPGKTAVGDACCLPVRTASVPDAVSVWLFQLVADRAAVMAEVRRALAPGGRYVVIPAGHAVQRESDLTDVLPRWHEVVLGRRHPLAEDEALVRLAEEAGLRCVDRALTAWQEWARSPNDEADRIEARAYGALLDVTDADWAAKVQPVVDRLRSMPEPDRARPRGTRHAILVFER